MNRIASLALLFLAASTVAQVKPEQRVANWLRNLDHNGDGKISGEEANRMLKNAMARSDANLDGFLEKNELLALAKRIGRNANRRGNRNRVMTDKALIARAGKGLVVEPNVRYREGKSERWTLDLVRPAKRGDAPRPAIVFVHGGGWRSGHKRRGYFIQGAIDYARKGYVCMSVNYRLTNEAPFPACIEDVKCAIRWLRAHASKYNVDKNRIGAYGNSAGAHLVSLAGLAGENAGLDKGPWKDESSALQAVCASATPTNFLINERWLKRFSGERGGLFRGTQGDISKIARLASPFHHVHEGAPPFLLVHGTADRVVDVEHGDTFVAALKKAKAKDVSYIRIDNASHGVFNQHRKKTHRAMAEFFDRTIGPGSRKKNEKTGSEKTIEESVRRKE